MDIRPIKTEHEYEATLDQISQLFEATPNTPDGDRLEVLTTLLEVYEAEHHQVTAPDPIEAILYHLESRGLSRRDLEPAIGGRGRVSEVLNRRRPLTLEMVRRLNAMFGIPAHVLIQPYALQALAA